MFLILLLSCSEPHNPEMILLQQKIEQAKLTAEISSELIYFQDPKTNLCFAYFGGGAANGGPALASVPYEAINLK